MLFLGVDFVDKRLEREEFGKLKETYPYKQVPILEIEGQLQFRLLTWTSFIDQFVNPVGAEGMG